MAEITFSNFGNYGRLGNCMFQYASLYGIAKKYNLNLELPRWDKEKYFVKPFPHYTKVPLIHINSEEPSYHYCPEWIEGLNKERNLNLKGYYQSQKWFDHCVPDIVANFEFKKEFKEATWIKAKLPDGKKNIVIQIRRTDYVNNPNYYQLPIRFYIMALFDNFPDWMDCNIVLVSDDINYCRNHFGCLPNAYFIDGFTDIEQVCVMSLCDGFIIANGTFGWWGAWLAEHTREGVKVVHSPHLFAGELYAKNGEAKDFYPERWVSFEHENKRIDLKNVTFTIPVFHDHSDRKGNLDLCVCILQKEFDTNIIIGEQGSDKFAYIENYGIKYVKYPYQHFHRTRMLNQMAAISETEIVANWDCDVIIPPLQIWLAAYKLEHGADMCYPYDGLFVRMARHVWFNKLQKEFDVGSYYSADNHAQIKSVCSTGGAILVNKTPFFEAGGENEKMISFGPEDWERCDRFKKFEYNVERVTGPLFHIDHYIGANSNGSNPFFKENHAEHDRIKPMNKEQLREYVDQTFTWVNEYKQLVQ